MMTAWLPLQIGDDEKFLVNIGNAPPSDHAVDVNLLPALETVILLAVRSHVLRLAKHAVVLRGAEESMGGKNVLIVV